MTPTDEALFDAWRQTRDPRLLGEVFDRTAAELLRIAACLCAGDRASTEDALQATFLTAMTDAGSFDATRRLLPWLLGILANHVRRERRARQRRAAADLASTEPTSADAAPAAAAASELRAALAQGLDRLASPYREVLVLHLDHDLDSVAIGRALGRKPATVRTQIARGLELLRAVLPAGLSAGILLAVSPALLAQVRARTLAAASTAAARATGAAGLFSAAHRGGFLLMLTSLVLVMATLMALWWPKATSLLPAPAVAAPAAPASAAAPPGSGPATRTPLPAPPGAEPTAPAAPRTVTVTVVHGTPATPLPGAAVALACQPAGWPTGALPTDVRLGTTDAQGRAVFTALRAAAGYTAQLVGTPVLANLTGDQREVTLAARGGADLLVRVADSQDAPIAGATVVTDGGPGTLRMWLPLGTTDHDGCLRAAHQDERTQLVAWAPGRGPSAMATLALHEGRPHTCTLRLTRPGFAVTARVVDERGTPVPQARVAFVPMAAWPMVETDADSAADGRCVAHGIPGGHLAMTALHTDGAGVVRRAVLRAEVTGDTELEVRLTRGARVQGAVPRLTLPGASASPTFRASYRPDAIHELPLLSTWTLAAPPSFRFDGLVPGRWQLSVRIGSQEIEQEFTLAEGDTVTWDPQPPATLEQTTLRLLDARGAPLLGWRVGRLNAWGFPGGGVGTTDATGLVQSPLGGELLEAGRPVRFAAWAPLPQGGDGDGFDAFPTFQSPPQPARAEMVVKVPDRCRPTRQITGTLRTRAGGPLPAWRLRIRDGDLQLGALLARATGDGGFAAGPLTPGAYTGELEVEGQPTLALGRIDVPADRDVDLGAITVDASSQVRVTLAGALTPDDLRLSLVSDVGADVSLRRHRDGTFTAQRVPFGRYTLRGTAPRAQVPPQSVTVDQDRVELTVRAAPCPTLRLTIVLPEDGDRSQTAWSGTLTVRDHAGAVFLRTTLEHPFAGHWQARLPFALGLPAGTWELELRTWNRHDHSGHATVTAEGGTVELPGH